MKGLNISSLKSHPAVSENHSQFRSVVVTKLFLLRTFGV